MLWDPTGAADHRNLEDSQGQPETTNVEVCGRFAAIHLASPRWSGFHTAEAPAPGPWAGGSCSRSSGGSSGAANLTARAHARHHAPAPRLWSKALQRRGSWWALCRGPYMACKGSGVQIPSAPPGTTHLPLTLAASSASNLPANDAEWPPQRGASPGLLVKGGFCRGQDDHQALLDRGHDTGGHLRGGVPVVGPDGAGLMPAGPPAGLVAHQLVDDPGRDAGVLQPGREGVAKVMRAVQVDRLQQGMLGGWPQCPPPRLVGGVGG